MAKKTIKRIVRTGKLSPQQAERDREFRRKILAEFPPLEAEPDSPILSDLLREAIA